MYVQPAAIFDLESSENRKRTAERNRNCSCKNVKRRKNDEKTKNERHKKQRKQRTSGRFFSPTNNFLVCNYGLRRAERWDDMPSMSSEVGEI